MLPRNNGITENEIMQNQFTAYVSRAIRNFRWAYLMNRSRRDSGELPFSEYQDHLASEDDPIQELLESELLRQVLQQIRDKERYIVLSRVVEEKSFAEIATEVNMTYKTVTSRYYRTMKRLKAYMEGVEAE